MTLFLLFQGPFMTDSTIMYTKTDESPALATYSLLPIVRAFTTAADINVELCDISLAGRILAQFPSYLTDLQRVEDGLSKLGKLALKPEANIIKLPNISASMPQLKAAIKELQDKGYALPNYPDVADDDELRDIQASYDKVKGSAVNPVLREGNSDRRAPLAVKNYVRHHPHEMGPWSSDSKTHVASMSSGDFFGSEQSITMTKNTEVRIELIDQTGGLTVLKPSVSLWAGEIIDAAVMNTAKLRQFVAAEIEGAKHANILFSVHLKATMMKVSDPIIFGHVTQVFYQPVLDKHQSLFDTLGINLNNGLGDVYNKISTLSSAQQTEILADITAVYNDRPALAMVDYEKGITNLHVPSDVIVDASMPAMIRSSGQMWNAQGQLQDTKAIIPDRCYAGIFQKTIEFCKENGAFDPVTMGTVPNVGLMAQKAEEYGSHDKTFEIAAAGSVRIIDGSNQVLIEHAVEAGDIWRMCQVKDLPIQDWVKLAVTRARLTMTPAIFWLDQQRAHDAQLITKVTHYLADHDTTGLDIRILSPEDAVMFSLKRIKAGQDTISVTGNVLRDYLTDLFPILELGTSAKMLSVVPLMNGGGLFETGAGGTAPKLLQQLQEENHLCWDSLGEFLALAASLEHLGRRTGNQKAAILSKTLDAATGRLLELDKSPSDIVGELDNRGSHFYLALYWAQALAAQDQESELKAYFKGLADDLTSNELKIVAQLTQAQGHAVDLMGYYFDDVDALSRIMRPSDILNNVIAKFTP
ncbi:MAG: isocitrate dehydrogenase [Methylophagaceae bacterium]|jgi:isocitrate dehydrogenase